MIFKNKHELFKYILDSVNFGQRQDDDLQQVVDVLAVLGVLGFDEIKNIALAEIDTKGLTTSESALENYIPAFKDASVEFSVEISLASFFVQAISNTLGCYDAADFFKRFNFEESVPKISNNRWAHVVVDETRSEEEGKFYIRFLPYFMDVKAAGHPEGIPISFAYFQKESDAHLHAYVVNKCMDGAIEDYESDKFEDAHELALMSEQEKEEYNSQYLKDFTGRSWTMVYSDYSDENKMMMDHVRFIPPFVSVDNFWSHGLSIGNVNFAERKDAENYADEIEAFMIKMMEDYDKYSSTKE